MLRILTFVMMLFASAFLSSWAFGQNEPQALEAIQYNYDHFSTRHSVDRQMWNRLNPNHIEHQEKGRLYYFSPALSYIEQIDRRTEHEKYYVDAVHPSRIIKQKGYLPLHYQKDGQWLTIDTRIQTKEAGIFEATQQAEPVGFDIASQQSYILTDKSIKVRFNDWLLIGERGTHKDVLAKPDWSDFTAGDDGLYIHNIFPGIDAEMRTLRGAIKTNFIIKDNRFKHYEHLLFEDHFDADADLELQFRHTKDLKQSQVGEAYVSNEGRALVSIGKAFAYSKAVSDAYQVLAYTIQSHAISLSIATDYIERYIHDGPLVIDPLVSASSTMAQSLIGSKYNATCTYVSSCDYDMDVVPPSGCTFTNTKFTFPIVGYSPCARSDGRFQVTFGACVPGHTWYCPGTGPGACGGTLSEWASFKACMPAPSCSTLSPLTFTLKVWRTCLGDTGCNSTCFGAYGNWVMTIEGRTVEHESGINISSVKDTVCPGTTVIFSKVTQNGITPYNATNWSTDRSGIPSVGSGDSLSRTFYAGGTYWLYATTTDACGNTALDSQRIYVSVPLFKVDTSSPVICNGSSVNINASAIYQGNALDFDGTSGRYVSIPNSPAVSLTGKSNFTVSAWVYPRSNAHQQILFHGLGCSSWHNWTLSLGGFEAGNEWWPKKLGFMFMTGNGSGLNWVSAVDTVVPNQWVHVSVTYDGNSLKIYLNGVLNNTASASGTPWNSPENLYMGFDPGCGGRIPYNGKLDEVQIWQKTRSAEEIKASYAALTDPLISDLKAYYRFDEDNGKNTYDVTDTSHGVLVGSVGREIPSTAPLLYADTGSLTYSWSPTTGLSSGTGASVVASPTSTTVYTITGTSSITGCANMAKVKVQVNPLPSAPTVSSPVVYCQNATAVALTATGTLLKWYTASTGGTGSSTAPTPGTATVGSTDYYVSQTTTTTGCEGPRAKITVQINSLPSAPTVSSPVVYCQNATAVALTATGTLLKWYTASTGGTGSSTAPTPSTGSSGSTDYYVSQTNTSTGCEGPRAKITVQINPLPSAPTVSTPVNYCHNATASALTATGTLLKWYTAATGGTGSSTAPTPSTTTVGSTDYYVSQTNTSTSCEGPRAKITVQVNPLPAAPVVETPLDWCQFSATKPLTASGTSGTSFRWYTVATGGTGSSTAISPSTAVVGSTSFYVSQVNNTTGCEGPRSEIVVNIRPNPVVNITTPSPIGFVVCKDRDIILEATYTTVADSFRWHHNSTIISGANEDTIHVTDYGDWGVIARDEYGCMGYDTVLVQVDTTPYPTLSSTDNMICREGGALLTCNPGYYSYVFDWQKDGSALLPASPKSNLRSVNLTGNYYVYVTNYFGCVDTTNIAIVTYHPDPIKPVILNKDPRLEVSSSYRYYQWYRSTSRIVGANDYYIITHMPGDYYVEVTDENGCLSYSDTLTINSSTGIANGTMQEGQLKIYPNPTHDKIYIESAFPINVIVTDVLGKVIFKKEDNPKELDMRMLADGTYFFRISNDRGQLISVEKILKYSR